MNYKYLLLLWMMIASGITTFSQTKVGYLFDINATPIEGYYNQLFYQPKQKIEIINQQNSFAPGSYYNKSGKKINGFIKYENKKIWFKKGLKMATKKLKPIEINTLTIGVDSFFTIKNFRYKTSIRRKPEFVKYLGEINDYTFVNYYHFTSDFALAGTPNLTETILVKGKTDTIWNKFPKGKTNFKTIALKHFGQVPYLKFKIQSGDFTRSDLKQLVKTAIYYNKYKNSEPLYFNRYWKESRTVKLNGYTANIRSLQDSIWTIEYFKDQVKLYEMSYSSIFPMIKTGDCKAFYSCGKIKQTNRYADNRLLSVKTSDGHENLKRYYEYNEDQKDQDVDPDFFLQTPVNKSYKYCKINKKHSITDSLCYSIKLNDTILKRELVQRFENYKLVESYFWEDSCKVYQIVDPMYKFKIKKAQAAFTFFINTKELDLQKCANTEGLILVKIRTDKKGYIEKYKILNKLHHRLELLLINFLENQQGANDCPMLRFKPFKVGKEKVACEFVIPFDFSTKQFYKAPVSYFWHHNHFFNHQFHQINMTPKFTPPPPPRF